MYPIIVRLPSHPGANAACARECSGIDVPTTTVFEVSIAAEFYSEGLKVVVAPPWRILMPAFGGQYCHTDSGSMNCLVGANNGGVVVYTDDPNAPSRNVYVSAVKMTATCP